MRARIALPLCLIALLLSSGCGSKSDTTIDTRFIPADAFSVIVAYPSRVLANPAIAKLDLSDMTKGMEKEMGFPLSDVEQIEMIITTPPAGEKGRSDPHMAAEFRMTKPHGGEAFVKKIISRSEPQKVEYAGKTYYKPGKDKFGYQAGSPTVYIVDDRTLLIGEELAVKASLDAKDAKSPLVDMLGKVDSAADFSFVTVQNDQIRKMVADAKAHGEMPEPLKPFADLTDSLNGSILSIKTTPEIAFALTMQTKDDASAEKLAAMIPKVKQMAEQGAAALHGFAVVAPPEAKPMMDYGFGKLDKIVVGLVAKRNGSEVAIQIDGLGTLDELATNVLAPAIEKNRAAAKLAQQSNNIRQLGIAMLNYESEFGGSLPTQAIYSKEGKPLLSWRVKILPYVEENELYKQFHLDEPWDSPNNKPLIAKMPKVFMSADEKEGEGKTRYVVPVGKGTLFDGDMGIRVEEIKDGTFITIMILEVGGDKAVTWTQPDDLPFDAGTPLAGLGAIGDGGVLAEFADGHSAYIRKTVDADTFRKLILRADGEPIDESKYLP